jgi:hypothetical protein
MRDAFYLSLNKVDYREKGLECQAGKDLPKCGLRIRGGIFNTSHNSEKVVYFNFESKIEKNCTGLPGFSGKV